MRHTLSIVLLTFIIGSVAHAGGDMPSYARSDRSATRSDAPAASQRDRLAELSKQVDRENARPGKTRRIGDRPPASAARMLRTGAMDSVVEAKQDDTSAVKKSARPAAIMLPASEKVSAPVAKLTEPGRAIALPASEKAPAKVLAMPAPATEAAPAAAKSESAIVEPQKLPAKTERVLTIPPRPASSEVTKSELEVAKSESAVAESESAVAESESALMAPQKLPPSPQRIRLVPDDSASVAKSEPAAVVKKPSLLARAGKALSNIHPVTWLRDNLTVSGEASDHLIAAKALRKEGRLEEAAGHLTSAPEPRGFVERFFVRHAEKKLRSASMASMKTAAKQGRVDDAMSAYNALVAMKGTMGRFAAWRANRAVAKTGKLSLAAARRAGKKGNLDAASDRIELASNMNATDRQLGKANARLEKDAIKLAKRSAKAGDLDATTAALAHATSVPDTRTSDEDVQAIFTKAASVRMRDLVKVATRAYAHGDADTAVMAMAQLKGLRDDTNIELTGGAHRNAVRMTALLGSRVDEALAAANEPAEDHAAEPDSTLASSH